MRPCEGKYAADRLSRNALKQFGRDFLGRLFVGMDKDRIHGKARAFDKPSAGKLAGYPFDIRAARPIHES